MWSVKPHGSNPPNGTLSLVPVHHERMNSPLAWVDLLTTITYLLCIWEEFAEKKESFKSTAVN